MKAKLAYIQLNSPRFARLVALSQLTKDVALDLYSGNDDKAAFDLGLGATAYAFPWVGGPLAALYGGWNIGTALDNGLPNPAGQGSLGDGIANGWAVVFQKVGLY